MTHESYRQFERLLKKGFNLRIPLLDREEWAQIFKADRSIPRSYSQLKWLGSKLFDRRIRRDIEERHWHVQPERGLLTHGVEECGEAAYHRFYTGLSNPFLSNAQLDDLESDMDADLPDLENSEETDHFVLKWTNASTNPADNIADSSIITDTGDFLEEAWEKYHNGFGRDPYVPPGESKIEVLFHDISGYGVSTPNGPIELDASHWVNSPGIRQPTSAHELFHRLQYSFGYRTVWTPSSPYKWFSEGTASWAEVFVWGRVSGDYKILDLFSNPDINLYDASYRALPFWVFYQARQSNSPSDNPMLGFLQKYELSGDEEQSLEDGIEDEWAPNNVHRVLPHFFALFSRERTRDAWKTGPTGAVYGDILDPDDNPISPALGQVGVPIGLGDSYTDSGTVSPLGSDYYKFYFQSNTDGATLAISVDGASSGDFSFYLVWEKEGAFTRGVFPFMLDEDYSLAETIDLDFANGLILIVSGRGTGGTYTLNASVS